MLDDVNETRDIGQCELVLNTELSSPVYLPYHQLKDIVPKMNTL